MKLFLIGLLLVNITYADIPKIDSKTRDRLGIITADLAAMELPPSIPAFASVLDPAPLVALIRQSDAAAETVAFSKRALDRAEKLFTNGNLVPGKDVEAARAQLVTNKASHQAILDTILATYGKTSDSVTKPEALLLSEKVLIRISTKANTAAQPIGATILITPPVTADSLTRAPMADPVFQNISWLTIVEGKNLVPGMSLPASLTLPGAAEKGHLLPASAVVWHLGIPWVFREISAGKFERIQAPDTRPTDGGWFISGEDFPVKSIVTTGAQLLLSSEISQPEEE